MKMLNQVQCPMAKTEWQEEKKGMELYDERVFENEIESLLHPIHSPQRMIQKRRWHGSES